MKRDTAWLHKGHKPASSLSQHRWRPTNRLRSEATKTKHRLQSGQLFLTGWLFVLPERSPTLWQRTAVKRREERQLLDLWRSTERRDNALLTLVRITVKIYIFLLRTLLRWVGYLTEAQIWTCEHALFFPPFYFTNAHLFVIDTCRENEGTL